MNEDHYRLNAAFFRCQQLKKTYLYVLAGYVLVMAATFIARCLKLTSMQYADIIILSSIVIMITVLMIIFLVLRKHISARFLKLQFYFQFAAYITIYYLWVLQLQEIRIFGLLCGLIALTFVLTNATFKQAIVISIGTTVAHLSATYIGIVIKHQTGNIIQELFYVIVFVPSFVFVSIIGKKIYMQRKKLRNTRNLLIEKNQHLIHINRQLQKFKNLSLLDMELASNVQKSLLRHDLPDQQIWDIAYLYKPHLPVSGDFYDFFFDGDKLLGLCLFDVTGHGVSAGLVAVLAKPIVYRKFIKMQQSPLPEVAFAIHTELVNEIGEAGMYVTGILLRFKGDIMEYINMGHPELLLKQNNDVTKFVPNEKFKYKSPPLGFVEYVKSKETVTVTLKSDDVVCLYSDCLVETADKAIGSFAENDVMALLKQTEDKTAEDMIEFIVGKFYEENPPISVKDDLTVIIVKRK